MERILPVSFLRQFRLSWHYGALFRASCFRENRNSIESYFILALNLTDFVTFHQVLLYLILKLNLSIHLFKTLRIWYHFLLCDWSFCFEILILICFFFYLYEFFMYLLFNVWSERKVLCLGKIRVISRGWRQAIYDSGWFRAPCYKFWLLHQFKLMIISSNFILVLINY